MPTKRFSTAILLSVVLHVLALLGIVVLASSRSVIDLNEKVVTIRLARLGKERDQTLLPRLDASEAQPVPKPVPVMASEAKPSRHLDDGVKKHIAEPSPLDVLKKRFGKASDEGSKQGSNMGSSIDSDLAESYVARVVEIIRQHYVLPTTLRGKKNLAAVIALRIHVNGSVLSVKVNSSSGNVMFDRSVTLVINRITSFGPPPLPLRKRYATEGFLFEFTP